MLSATWNDEMTSPAGNTGFHASGQGKGASISNVASVIERILRHLGLWQEGGASIPAPTRRAKRPSIRNSTTPSPTTKTEPVVAFSAT
jgi:hypothetical protein